MPNGLEKNYLIEAENRIQKALKNEQTDLDLSDLRLEFLPESLGQLTSLGSLDLSNNQLTDLPESMGRLTKLANT